jgi:hypothetical protein
MSENHCHAFARGFSFAPSLNEWALALEKRADTAFDGKENIVTMG